MVVKIGEMGVGMMHARVPMPMRVRLFNGVVRRMLVAMVLVMNMDVFMLLRLVVVQMLMLFGEM